MCLTVCCCTAQFVANDSNRDEVIADFRAALDPIRATLKEYPWLGGADGPKYADIYLMAFFMVRCSPLLALPKHATQAKLSLSCMCLHVHQHKFPSTLS